MCPIYDVLLQKCDLRSFVAISVLSQFTHFCVEQKWTEHSCLWSKKDKYDVWLLGGGVFVMLARNIVTTIVNKLITKISQNSPPNLVTHGIVSLFGTKYGTIFLTQFSDDINHQICHQIYHLMCHLIQHKIHWITNLIT